MVLTATHHHHNHHHSNNNHHQQLLTGQCTATTTAIDKEFEHCDVVVNIPTATEQTVDDKHHHHHHHQLDNNNISWRRLTVLPIYAILNLLLIVLLFLPLRRSLDLKMIHTMDDLKHLHKILTSEQAKQYQYQIFALYSSVYVFIQAFSVPGSLFMNILGGALFGVLWATLLCALLTAVGSSVAFCLIGIVGKDIINALPFLRDRVAQMEVVIAKQTRNQLFVYLISARLFPLSPNWLLNIASSLVSVDLHQFFITTLIGLLPFHWVTVKAGLVLSELDSAHDAVRLNSLLLLCLLSLVLLLPALLQRSERIQKWLKFE